MAAFSRKKFNCGQQLMSSRWIPMNIDFLSPDCRIENGFCFLVQPFVDGKKRLFWNIWNICYPFPSPIVLNFTFVFSSPFSFRFMTTLKHKKASQNWRLDTFGNKRQYFFRLLHHSFVLAEFENVKWRWPRYPPAASSSTKSRRSFKNLFSTERFIFRYPLVCAELLWICN